MRTLTAGDNLSDTILIFTNYRQSITLRAREKGTGNREHQPIKELAGFINVRALIS